MKRAIVITIVVALLVPFSLEAKKRVSHSPYTLIINENGLDSIWLGAVKLAAGGLQLVDGTWFYEPFSSRNFEPTIVSKSVSYNGNVATVDHTYSGALAAHVVYTYTSVEGDISVDARVENLGGLPISIPAFRSPYFLWDSWNVPGAIQSNGLNWNPDHTQSQGIDLTYPSVNVRFAATYATGMAGGGFPLNISTWTKEDPFSKFMTIPFGKFGVQGVAWGNFFFDSIPAGGSRTFKFAFRLSGSTDWHVLLQPYKDLLRQRFPTLPYTTDARPMVQFVAIDPSYVRADNPYGYNDSGDANCTAGGLCRRFDKFVGCQNFVSKLVPPMVATNYQGIIFWQPQGIHPRGVQYRPDFDVFPAVTYPNLPTLVNGFRNAGLTVGLLARPGKKIVATSPTTDGLIPFPTLNEAVSDIQTRIAWALANGFNAWYIDSFVIEGYDHDLMVEIRSAAGNVQTFCELSTALSMAFSSAYEEMQYTGGKYLVSRGLDVLRWIYPEAIVITKFFGALPPGGYAELYAYMFANKYTPLVEDYRAIPVGPGSENVILQPLVQTYIDHNNQWRVGAIRGDAIPRQKANNRQLAVNRGAAVDRQ